MGFDTNRVNIYTSTYTVYWLVKSGFLTGELDTGNFSREHEKWDIIQKSRFIESILLRIPVQSMYFDMTHYGKTIIIDGYQRLSAIKSFVVNQEFYLEGLEYLKDLEGCTFKSLPRNLSRRIEWTKILCHSVRPITPESISNTIYYLLHTI